MRRAPLVALVLVCGIAPAAPLDDARVTVISELGVGDLVPSGEVEIRLWQEGVAWVRSLDRFRSSSRGVSGERCLFVDVSSFTEAEDADVRKVAVDALTMACDAAPTHDAGSVVWCRSKLRKPHDARLLERIRFDVLWDLSQENDEPPALPHARRCPEAWPCLECLVMDGRSLTVEIFSSLGARTGSWGNPGVCCKTPRCLAAQKVLITLDRVR